MIQQFGLIWGRPGETRFRPNRSTIHFYCSEMTFFNGPGNLEKSHFGIGRCMVERFGVIPVSLGGHRIRKKSLNWFGSITKWRLPRFRKNIPSNGKRVWRYYISSSSTLGGPANSRPLPFSLLAQ